MNRFRITSRCECQALLVAVLDEHHHVVEGSAERLAVIEVAPAHSIGADGDRFDVAWLCPFCGRNSLRMFHVGAMHPLPEQAAPAAAGRDAPGGTGSG